MDDQYDLRRFVEAQDSVYAEVCAELRAGRKQTHWMWFIFPQIRGLGSSPMAVRYAIHSLAEARAYLAHPVLGPRLRECAGLVVGLGRQSDVKEVFGSPDDLKFHSSMTLFARAVMDSRRDRVFLEALQRYFDGAFDEATLARLDHGSATSADDFQKVNPKR